MQAGLPGFDVAPGRTDAPEVLDELEVDYTPAGVVVQLLLALFDELQARQPGWAPAHVLDPSAGSGVFGRALRALLPDAHLTGLEPRVSEWDNLVRAYDRAAIGRAQDVGDGDALDLLGMWDLIATNCPWSGFSEGWPLLFRRRHRLTARGAVALYGPTQWGQAAEHQPILQAWSPALQIRVAGRVKHRGEGTKRLAPIPAKRRVPGGPTHEWRENGADSREVCLWVWLMTHNPAKPYWTTIQLPELPAELRTWHPESVPGTYPIEPALVAEIKERYL